MDDLTIALIVVGVVCFVLLTVVAVIVVLFIIGHRVDSL